MAPVIPVFQGIMPLSQIRTYSDPVSGNVYAYAFKYVCVNVWHDVGLKDKLSPHLPPDLSLGLS